MSTKLLILIFFALHFSSAKSACKTGYFTKNSPCDTKATPVPCKEFTSIKVNGAQWHYFYLPLRGIGDNFELEFRLTAPYHHFVINYQSADSDNLPDSVYNDSYIDISRYGEDIHTEYLTSKNAEVMVLGFYNRYFESENVEIRYFTKTGDCKRPESRFFLVIIIGTSVGIVLIGCFGAFIMRKQRQRNATRRQNENRPEPEAQIILLAQPLPIQNENKNSDFLTLEDLQKYFPKKCFKDFENLFQQSGCSVCLEDFSPEISCHQLYCNHIFHELCAQKWLEKHNNCPGCRVPIGKKSIEDFIQKQRKMKEDKALDAFEIQIQSREYEKE